MNQIFILYRKFFLYFSDVVDNSVDTYAMVSSPSLARLPWRTFVFSFSDCKTRLCINQYAVMPPSHSLLCILHAWFHWNWCLIWIRALSRSRSPSDSPLPCWGRMLPSVCWCVSVCFPRIFIILAATAFSPSLLQHTLTGETSLSWVFFELQVGFPQEV